MNPLKSFIKSFNHSNPSWENLPNGFPDCDLERLDSSEIGNFLSIKTTWELAGKPPVNSRKFPSNSRLSNLPFRIPIIEKTTRQAQSLQGYKASGSWQTVSLLRDLIQLLLENITEKQFRRKTQLEDAARSMVANIEEGWARPTTKEFLDYLGFSQGSLSEIRGDIERLHTDSYLKTKGIKIPTPSPNFPYPPVKSRKDPGNYGKLRERLRGFTGRDLKSQELSFELMFEFVNKSDYLLRKTVEGLQNKVIKDEKQKFSQEINSHWRKNW